MATGGRQHKLSTRPLDLVSKADGRGQSFSIVSYNVLADSLLFDNRHLYPDSHLPYLYWDYRGERLLQELLSFDAEILCLQEVEQKHWKHLFSPKLREKGYESLFMSRTGRKTDGCAIFYRRSAFKLIGQRFVEYKKPGCRVLDKDNIGLIALFQSYQSVDAGAGGFPDILCVACTHLLFNHKRGDVKLAQSMILLAEVERMASLTVSGTKVMCPVIIAGDFNCRPLSSLYHFLVRGRLIYGDIARKSVDGEHPMDWTSSDRVPLKDCAQGRYHYLPDSVGVSDWCHFESRQAQHRYTVTHDLRLQSAYEHSVDNETDYTTRHLKASCTVDFIFYSPQTPSDAWYLRDDNSYLPYRRGLRLLNRRRPVSGRRLPPDFVLPNREHSSDHLPLQARFQFAYPVHPRKRRQERDEGRSRH